MKQALLFVLAAVAACGRIGFDPGLGSDGDAGLQLDGDASGNGQDAVADADPAVACVGGDGVCRVSCLTIDPDCETTCGDGVCVGNAGELCTSCAECNTQQIVCGNGACESGEDSDVCHADCGPSPWPWSANEADLLQLIDAARVNGVTCPGSGSPTTATALQPVPGLTQGAREWAWEIAHHESDGVTCNGRTLAQRLGAAGTSGAAAAWTVSSPSTTPLGALDLWLQDATTCQSIMDTAFTRIGAGVAIDAKHGYAIMLD